MTDPLGLIRSTGSPSAIGPSQAGGASGTPRAGEPDFKDVLLENLKKVNELQQDATRAVEDLQTGKRSDYEGVIVATQKADVAFRMLQAVRNRVMEAYDEIKQMRV
jgi:flagellar hook-basal body complex protein FliE